MAFTRKCTRCTNGKETAVVGQFWTCDRCDRLVRDISKLTDEEKQREKEREFWKL